MTTTVAMNGNSVLVASYNVHGCVGTDRTHNPERVGTVVASLGASVVALQEIDSRHEDDHPVSDLERVAAAAGLRAVAGAVRTKISGPYGNALLTAWPIHDVRRVDLTIGRHEPRGALDADLQVGPHRVRVVVTHLGLMPGERRRQTRMLIEWIAKREGETAVTILLGDLNEWFIWGRPLRWLHRHFGWSPYVKTFPSAFPFLALDRAWAEPKEALLQVKRVYNRQTRVASDHLPIVAELKVQ